MNRAPRLLFTKEYNCQKNKRLQSLFARAPSPSCSWLEKNLTALYSLLLSLTFLPPNASNEPTHHLFFFLHLSTLHSLALILLFTYTYIIALYMLLCLSVCVSVSFRTSLPQWYSIFQKFYYVHDALASVTRHSFQVAGEWEIQQHWTRTRLTPDLTNSRLPSISLVDSILCCCESVTPNFAINHRRAAFDTTPKISVANEWPMNIESFLEFTVKWQKIKFSKIELPFVNVFCSTFTSENKKWSGMKFMPAFCFSYLTLVDKGSAIILRMSCLE